MSTVPQRIQFRKKTIATCFSPIERAVSENYVACKYLMQPHLQKQFETFKNLLTLRTPSLRERKNISDVCLC